jgi:hypothetical protein
MINGALIRQWLKIKPYAYPIPYTKIKSKKIKQILKMKFEQENGTFL